ncbi:hypothetical protein [Tengunoibacter tsumagoiensis]|uniref:IPT/TIG domain-containing protein n=1 Tax=Tengunoibacter tsumagoiensis TaxID=2014871 RepID=A0A401ZX56_9CHLR|nr:hypothetical protein [Tengunoibacter tsumagoiensis]GCE11431.1 hypothetical protein KTT_12900 [Tengunoibacter tsumagoiensis]
MFKTFFKRIALLLFAVASVSLLILLSTPATLLHAASRVSADTTPTPSATATTTVTPTATATTSTQTVSLSMPNTQSLLGHPGTKITVTGTGFTPGSTVNLYTTLNSSTCGANQGLSPLGTNNTASVQADKTFSLSTVWPQNAGLAATSYYICAVSANAPDEKAVSTQQFTVAQDVTVTIAQSAVNPGDTIIISGQNWVPAQKLSVGLVSNGSTDITQAIASGNVKPSTNGDFQTTLILPKDIPNGAYTIIVVATNEPTLKLVKDNFITIGSSVTPTPTTGVTPTAQATPTPTPAADTTSSGGTSGTTILIFAMGGLGIILVIIGIIMLSVYSRHN